jgi:hypothetical protein
MSYGPRRGACHGADGPGGATCKCANRLHDHPSSRLGLAFGIGRSQHSHWLYKARTGSTFAHRPTHASPRVVSVRV